MKRSLLPFFLLISGVSFAQQEGNAFTTTGRAVATTFVTDYEAASINPANQAWGTGYDNKHVAVGLFEVSFSAFTDALSRKELRNTLRTGKDFDQFTPAEKVRAASQFNEKGMSINFDMSVLSMYYHNDKVGGFSFGVKDRVQYYTKFNEQTADLLFNGYRSSYFDSLVLENGNTIANNPNDPNYEFYNIQKGVSENPLRLSTIFNGTEVNVTYTREYDISYGNYIVNNEFIKVGAGVSLKWVHGFGTAKLKSENGKLEGFTSVSPDFDIDFGEAALSNPSAIEGGSRNYAFPKKVGEGFGADIGFNIVINNKIKIGTAVNEIGSIKWTGNVYELNDTLLTEVDSDGFDSYNVITQVEEFFDLDGIIKWSGKKSYTTQLPTTWRLGASYEMIDGKAHAGMDVVIPLNDAPGNFASPVYALGGDISPARWVQFQLGLSYGGNTRTSLNAPIGIKFIAGEYGTWEVGFASRDFITWFSKNSPHISASMGFLRFRF